MLDTIQMKILDKRIGTEFPIPTFKTGGAAAMDIPAMIDGPIAIPPGHTAEISAGVAIFIKDPNYVGLVIPRSGTGSKGYSLRNTIGVIDADYQGPIIMKIRNTSHEPLHISPGDRVAQYMIVPVLRPQISIVDDFNETTERGEGGFGHTGKN